MPFVVIDSPSFANVSVVRNGSVMHMPMNEHGEADYVIRYHVARSQVLNTLVVSKDTDTWTYGLALIEAGILESKNVIVKRGNSGEYVNISHGCESLRNISSLKNIKYPITSVVALYVFTGCDYVSSFFRLTKKYFMSVFLEHAKFICSESDSKSSVIVRDNSIYLDESNVIQLACTAYLLKYPSVLNGVSVDQFRFSLMNPPISRESEQLLKYLGYSPSITCISTLQEWSELIRRITFHMSNATKDFESCLLPTYTALAKHALRASYVLKLVFSITSINCTVLNECDSFQNQMDVLQLM